MIGTRQLCAECGDHFSADDPPRYMRVRFLDGDRSVTRWQPAPPPHENVTVYTPRACTLEIAHGGCLP
jgi:hypothetical protein